MNQSLVDDTANFFLQDAVLRLSRSIEVAVAYSSFVLLLYCRLLSPGSFNDWRWFHPMALWVVVFLPLFVLDWRNLKHVSYLRANRRRFSSHESQRYFLIVASECIYKVLLCVHLMFVHIRPILTLKAVMMPYTIGYVLHFILGHFVPLDEGDRPEGCNAISSLLSELGRFIVFVLVISLSLKVERVSDVVYNWQAAFWPCWGLEGIIILVVVLLLPVCAVSAVVDRPKAAMLSWVLCSAAGLGAATFASMYSVAKLLDEGICPSPPYESTEPGHYECAERLAESMWPWLAFLPSFALFTMLLKRQLAESLHESWYQPSRNIEEGNVGIMRTSGLTAIEELPAPTLMFRITPTYYSRACDPGVYNADASHVGGSALANSSLARMLSLGGGSHGGGRSSRNQSRPHSHMGSMNSRIGSLGQAVDPSTSILSARGSTFTEIVESEQLCFVCYDQSPDAILLECGHAGLCTTCASHLLERRPGSPAFCPICRTMLSCVLRLRPDLPVPSNLFIPTPSNHMRQSPARDVETANALASSAALTRSQSLTASLGGQGVPGQGPPWPATTKRNAVMVEVVRRAGRPSAGRWRMGFFPRS